jgi:RNA binding exosome subunit
MYVRWNKRKRFKIGWRKKEGHYLSAILVESHRVDGAPRQKIIKFLGSIGEENLHRVFWCQDFWVTAEKNLAALGLSAEDQQKIIAIIEKVVPKPSEDDLNREREEGFRVLKELGDKILARRR